MCVASCYRAVCRHSKYINNLQQGIYTTSPSSLHDLCWNISSRQRVVKIPHFWCLKAPCTLIWCLINPIIRSRDKFASLTKLETLSHFTSLVVCSEFQINNQTPSMDIVTMPIHLSLTILQCCTSEPFYGLSFYLAWHCATQWTVVPV
eukprot:c17908_g1_i1 orf=191-634(-)